MNHLSETLLNEYLDQVLDREAFAAASKHLAVCAKCRDSLDELQALSEDLRFVTDEPLLTDLTGPVLSVVKAAGVVSGWNLFLAAQAGFVLGIVLCALSFLPSGFKPFAWLMPLPSLLAGFNFPFLQLPVTLARLMAGALTYRFPTILFQLTSLNVLILAAASLLLLGLENIILLQRGKTDR